MNGKQLKLDGQNIVEANNRTFVEMMRLVAKEICLKNGEVTADDVRDFSDRTGVKPLHPNAWGSVFRKGSGFKRTGYRPSTRPAAHARVISVWAIK